MKPTQLLTALAVTTLLAACQSPPPSSGGSSGGSSGSSGGGGLPGGGLPGGGLPGGGLPGGGLPGGGLPGGGLPGGGPDGGKAGSSGSGESLEDLDATLDRSLEDFDDSVAGQGSGSIDILSPSGGSTAGIESDEPLFEEGDLGSEGIENADFEQRASEGGGTGSGESAPGSGSIASTGSSSPSEPVEAIPIPEDIGDGQGDDIVLRQIRDAAMKEKDPILREKLWEEYRRIKGQR